MFGNLVNLIYPSNCLLCKSSSSNESLCDLCKERWQPTPRKLSNFDFPAYAAIKYDSAAMKIVLLAKEEGIRSAQELLKTALLKSIRSLIRNTTEEIWIVPIPTSEKPYRKRGLDPILELAKQICREARRADENLICKSILEVRRKVRDQTGLNNLERLSNLAGAFQVKSDLKESPPIIVIDDVVATGSTLREAVRALKERNLTVIGGASACSTFRH